MRRRRDNENGRQDEMSIMVAEHEIPLMVAAYQAGISGLDPEKILAAAVKMQSSLPQNTPGGGRVGNENIEAYLKYGYVPADGPLHERTSDTEEYAYDDWTVGQLALALGHKELAETFLTFAELAKRLRYQNRLCPPARG
jgi:putative alpha-1,2-mannosidase